MNSRARSARKIFFGHEPVLGKFFWKFIKELLDRKKELCTSTQERERLIIYWKNTRAMDLYPGWITYRQKYYSLKRWNEFYRSPKSWKQRKYIEGLYVIPRITHKSILSGSGSSLRQNQQTTPAVDWTVYEQGFLPHWLAFRSSHFQTSNRFPVLPTSSEWKASAVRLAV